jgi:hypothetical protein
MRWLFGCVIAALMLSQTGHLEPTTSFCDLLQNPQKYEGKEVTVRATWRYGFESSELYCLDCHTTVKTWLEISGDLDDASAKAIKRTPKDFAIVNITVQGTFRSGGRYGHMDMYPNRFIARKVSDVKIVLKGLKSPEEMKEAEKRWACGGLNPK